MMPAHKTICNILGVTDRPINNHRNESIQGNSTIRAFKKENIFIAHNTELVDKNTLAHKTSIAIWVWFGLANAMNVICISTLSVIIMIFFKTDGNSVWKAMTLNKIW
jgi:ABC-type multidrug transport system fused ATPase/permease subunit